MGTQAVAALVLMAQGYKLGCTSLGTAKRDCQHKFDVTELEV